MKKLSLFLFLIGFILFPIQAEISEEKKQEIQRLLHVTGIDQSLDDLKLQLLKTLRSQMPEQPSLFWEKFITRMDTRDLEDKLILLYDRYYTLEDLKSINAFYESPAGQKMSTFWPDISKESSKLAKDWGQNIRHLAEEEAKSVPKKE